MHSEIHYESYEVFPKLDVFVIGILITELSFSKFVEQIM